MRNIFLEMGLVCTEFLIAVLWLIEILFHSVSPRCPHPLSSNPPFGVSMRSLFLSNTRPANYKTRFTFRTQPSRSRLHVTTMNASPESTSTAALVRSGTARPGPMPSPTNSSFARTRLHLPRICYTSLQHGAAANLRWMTMRSAERRRGVAMMASALQSCSASTVCSATKPWTRRI